MKGFSLEGLALENSEVAQGFFRIGAAEYCHRISLEVKEGN